jgi:hypothetical protein
MNVNKLYKMLVKTSEDFSTLEKYRNILSSTARIAVDFTAFKDFNKLPEIITPLAIAGGLVFPFDNVMFDILGLTVANPANGKREQQPLMLHTVPIKITTDISTFHIMLIQDMRALNGSIFPRSHIVSLEKELAIMPAVDEGMPAIGCKCYERNPMSMSMLFRQIQSFTPGFVADCGFALPTCKSTLSPCKQLLSDSREIVNIAIATMFYSMLPCHIVVKVTEQDSSETDLKNKPYYVICDEESFAHLTTKGFPLPLKVQDVEAFQKALTAPPLTISGTITKGAMTYQVIPRPTEEEIEMAAGDKEKESEVQQ